MDALTRINFYLESWIMVCVVHIYMFGEQSKKKTYTQNGLTEKKTKENEHKAIHTSKKAGQRSSVEKKLNAKATTATAMIATATTNTTISSVSLFICELVSEFVVLSHSLLYNTSVCRPLAFREQCLSFGFSLELHKMANCFLSFYSMLMPLLPSSVCVLPTPFCSRWPVDACAYLISVLHLIRLGLFPSVFNMSKLLREKKSGAPRKPHSFLLATLFQSLLFFQLYRFSSVWDSYFSA